MFYQRTDIAILYRMSTHIEWTWQK